MESWDSNLLPLENRKLNGLELVNPIRTTGISKLVFILIFSVCLVVVQHASVRVVVDSFEVVISGIICLIFIKYTRMHAR